MSTSSSSAAASLDTRAAAARDWAFAALQLPADSRFAPASADASFRRYFRIEPQGPRPGADSWIVMDAPPEREDCQPFIHVAGLLHEAGLNVPQIIAQDLERGFLLLSDLGRQTYLQVLKDGSADADALMRAAIDALLRWQLASRPGQLPRYDAPLLQRELALFPDWYVARHLRTALKPSQAEALAGIERLLIDSALAQPQVFVHRDYMPRNLMISTINPGILDFQDAVEGPLTYDVVSLFRDAFWSWPEERIVAWRAYYVENARRAGLPIGSDAEFARQFDWMGLQRHLKVIGIFARINYRDGKPHYLADVPRFIGYVREVAQRHPQLQPLLRLFDELGLQA